ncbi:MAG: excinuclease ABC subunit UvrB [Patescibacteria group bacterium]
MPFKLRSPFKPTGDQPMAIKKLVGGLAQHKHQTLLGVTGSGKTFTMANVIQRVQKPTLIISHNKTLAAQLASEFEDFFPENSVHYFVSYYDYYQPEAYIPRSDTYIEKETQMNEEIDRLRHASTAALLSRDDVIIVASVSCIYGLGSPTEYKKDVLNLRQGQHIKRDLVLFALVNIQYQRNQTDLWRNRFRVQGDVVEVFPSSSENNYYQIRFWGDSVEKIVEIDSLTRAVVREHTEVDIYPAKHYLAPDEIVKQALAEIEHDMDMQVAAFKKANKYVEAQRLEERTRYDLDMIREVGYCNGIENYSRYFDQRTAGQPPSTLIDFFPKDFLLFIDESHMTIPQIRGMYFGDRSRKETLVRYGFRLPAAMDNRPLQYEEFSTKINRAIYVSATPGEYEQELSTQTVEQLIRPTGLLDPTVEIRATEHQIDNLLEEIRVRVNKKQRVLVTTLTKRMAEDLTDYLADLDIKVQYLHSEVDTMERLEILRDLRTGKYDVLIGINLLREGLDLPEVSLIAILDADKEGYLRSDTALIQTMGRAARHVEGHIIMYADAVTQSMRRAIDETVRRRTIQESYNTKHGITPQSITKAIKETRLAGAKTKAAADTAHSADQIPPEEIPHLLADMQSKMELAAQNLEFEEAARLRDWITEIENSQQPKRRRKK